jgi:polyisoprenoid-binding protein YceI
MDNHSSPALAVVPGYQPGTWVIDRAHSVIRFSVRQLLVAKVTGRFTGFDATIRTGEGPFGSSVEATIDLGSIDTGNPKRDKHIRSSTFLDVARHPSARYRSTEVRRAAAGWVVDGELTLHGITSAVRLTFSEIRFDTGPDGVEQAHFSATSQLRRGDFGIDAWTGGGLVVTDKVTLSLEMHATRS